MFQVIEIHRASSIVLMWGECSLSETMQPSMLPAVSNASPFASSKISESNKSLLGMPEDVFVSFLFVAKTALMSVSLRPVEASIFLELFMAVLGAF